MAKTVESSIVTIPLDFDGKRSFSNKEFAAIKKKMEAEKCDFVKAYNLIYRPELVAEAE